MHNRLTLFTLTLLASSTIHATSCTQFVRQVNKDIANKKQEKNPNWITLAMLHQNLGQTKKVSMPNGAIQYKWTCSSEIYLTAETNADNQLTKVSGQYSDDNSAEIFSAEMNGSNVQETHAETNMTSSQASAAPAPVPATPAPTPAPANPASTNAPATSCQATIKEIYDSHKKAGDAFMEAATQGKAPLVRGADPEWMNVSWLNQKLNTPKTEEVTYTDLEWDNFAVFVESGKVTAMVGPLPAGIDIKSSIDAIKQAAGAPKVIENETIYKYNWSCDNSNLSLTADKQGRIFGGSIVYANNRGFSTSSISGSAQPYTKEKFNKFMQKLIDVETAKKNVDKLKKYNDHFKTSFSTMDELIADNTVRVRAVYAAIKNCQPGSYEYFYDIMISGFITSVIDPLKDNVCTVNSTLKTDGRSMSKKCNYSEKSLPLFTDAEAESVAKGNFSFNSNKLSPMQEVDQKECTNG